MLYKKRRPPKWVETIVYISAHPKERQDELISLRRRYRRVLAASDQRQAKRLAHSEAFYWIIKAWPERLLHIARLIWQLIVQGGGWS
jgi:hypothetical protein